MTKGKLEKKLLWRFIAKAPITRHSRDRLDSVSAKPLVDEAIECFTQYLDGILERELPLLDRSDDRYFTRSKVQQDMLSWFKDGLGELKEE